MNSALINSGTLAIDGGPPTRQGPPPPRRAFGEAELAAVRDVFEESWRSGVDFGIEGIFERRFTERYAAYHGGGFADGVNAGSTALYVALAAMDLPRGSDVIVSPVTNAADPMAVALLGLRPVVADSAPDRFNVDAQSLAAAITPATKAALLTHSAGLPMEMDPIMALAEAHGIAIIEDTSQAHGATLNGQPVGTWGRSAAASTGFTKTLATGGRGGVIYTRDEALHWSMRAHADRGKPLQRPDFDQRHAETFQFPALNFNMDELSAAIGLSLLERLDAINARRLALFERIRDGLVDCPAVRPLSPPKGSAPAFFYATMLVEPAALRVDAQEFAEAVAAEGIWLNPHYRELVAEWPWYRDLTGGAFPTPNAVACRDRSFNLLFHEGFADSDADDIVAAILKVARALDR